MHWWALWLMDYLDLALANDCVPFREFSINEAVNFPKVHRINQEKGLGYPGNEFWNNFWNNSNSIISFISAQFTNLRKSQAFWSRRENQRNDVLNLLERTATLTPEVVIESCPDYPCVFPVLKWRSVLLLNHSNLRWNIRSWTTHSVEKIKIKE